MRSSRSAWGLDVVGQNLANINTPGYSRRTLDLAEVAATDALNAGRGVTVQGVPRAARSIRGRAAAR
jgi:flagellar hook-associated protein 1 FlgK